MPAAESDGSIERRAMELRRAGASFARIAEQLGLADEVEAYDLVTSAIGDTAREPVELSRAIEVDRLDRLMMALWPAAMKGDMQALDRVIKIITQRCRLLGLNQPATTAAEAPPVEDPALPSIEVLLEVMPIDELEVLANAGRTLQKLIDGDESRDN